MSQSSYTKWKIGHIQPDYKNARLVTHSKLMFVDVHVYSKLDQACPEDYHFVIKICMHVYALVSNITIEN